MIKEFCFHLERISIYFCIKAKSTMSGPARSHFSSRLLRYWVCKWQQDKSSMSAWPEPKLVNHYLSVEICDLKSIQNKHATSVTGAPLRWLPRWSARQKYLHQSETQMCHNTQNAQRRKTRKTVSASTSSACGRKISTSRFSYRQE